MYLLFFRPTSDLEMRTPKNRAKRGRGQAATPVNELLPDVRVANVKLRNGAKGRRGSATSNAFVAPASPLKGCSVDQWPKRKTRGSENESQDEPTPSGGGGGGGKTTKRLKVSINKEERNKDRPSNSPVPLSDLEKSSGPSSPALIECPEPNCSKKYKHINGLRYHQSHQHQSHAHNNFAEDSDSNASTASTQLATPTDQQPSSSEPMAIDNICDMDDEASPTTMDELISVSKRPSGSNGNLAKIDDSSMYDPQDENARISDKEYSDTQSLPLSSISGKSANKSGNNKVNNKVPESDSNKSFESLSKDTCLSSNASSVPRGAILTVPSFRSIGHSIHSSRDQENTVMKPTPILQPKGIPWQPHVHNPVVAPHTQHSPSSTGITLNIPGEKHTVSTSKDKSSEGHAKKNKHKKKSKDKDKDGKSKSDLKSDRSSSKDTGARIGKFSHLSNSSGASEGRGPSADDLRPSVREELNFGDGNNAGVVGETRDDPLSPAYSDISDANDSGDADLNVTVVKDGNNSDLKKDTPTVAPYFSPFYTPYMEPKLADPTPVGLSPSDEAEKLKTGQQHSHIMQQNLPSSGPPPPSSSSSSVSNACDESGRSPKMDFPHHPKYLPHQQHYFHYPYSNYHFDQGHGQFNNVMSENSFNPPRGFISSDERDKEKEISGDALKNKLLERDIKQEPGLKDGGRPLNMLADDKFCGEIKSEFGSSDYEQPPKSMSHHYMPHQTCSKHSKDLSSKQRDDMNKGGDHFRPGDKSKEDSDKEISKEKDKNNEGAKPTMETTGPPPPPTAGSYAYIPQPYLQPGSPFGIPFDPGHPLYRQVLVPGPYGGSPYMHPGSMPRYAQPSGNTLPLPEDLSRPPNVQQNTSSGAAKALDLLQHHAQYYQVHKIHG